MIMKKQLLFALILTSLYLSATATVRTVSNNPANLAQFNEIQDAVTASTDGDTIYVHGSPNTYNSFTLTDMHVTVIGPGWAPDKNLPLQAIVAGCTFNNTNATGTPSGTELQGLIFISNVTTQSPNSNSVNNLRFIRCQFNQQVNFSVGSSGTLIEGCIFITTVSFNGGANYTNLLFQNNIFFANACCTGSGISGLTNSVNVLFNHNLFYSDGSAASGGIAMFSGNCRFLTLTNNIFNKRKANDVSFSTFNNNITFNCGPNDDTIWIRNSNVDGGGNIASQDPQMADQVTINAGGLSGLLNFNIAAGPADNAGTDGKDLGLLFDATGSLNWTNSRNSRLPRIASMNITNPTVAPGGTLNVNVTARKSN